MSDINRMSQVLQETLRLNHEPVSVKFNDTPPSTSHKPDGEYYCDTACTALCRCLKRGKTLVIAPEGNEHGLLKQPCRGANFFFGWGEVPLEDGFEDYVNIEQVCASREICQEFLRSIPSCPKSIEGKLIALTPLSQETDTPQLVIILANAEQAGRILGLSVYHQYQGAIVLPGIPTCLSLYLPLTDGKIYINLIDYYDRSYQGMQKDGQSIWDETEMLISIPFALLQVMVDNIETSSHGNFRPNLDPQPFDIILE